MGKRAIDRLFQQWYQLGGAVMVAEVDVAVTVPNVEAVIAESTTHARRSGRLTWVVLDWLIRNVERVDEWQLLQASEEQGDLSVLGVLCDLARSRRPHTKFDWLVEQCESNDPREMFFHRLARYSITTQLAQEDPHEVFFRWGYFCRAEEVRFLTG